MARSLTSRSTNPKIMDDNIKILDNALAAVSTPPAEDVSYDNTDSGLTADNVQDAIDEVITYFSKELKTEASLRFCKRGNVASVYGDLSDLAGSTSISLGTTTITHDINGYVILPVFSRTAPYTPVGSIWISVTGQIELYKPADVTQCYTFGTYVCK